MKMLEKSVIHMIADIPSVSKRLSEEALNGHGPNRIQPLGKND